MWLAKDWSCDTLVGVIAHEFELDCAAIAGCRCSVLGDFGPAEWEVALRSHDWDRCWVQLW